ncbi:unnamed protein product [Rhodiola kirilowii]
MSRIDFFYSGKRQFGSSEVIVIRKLCFLAVAQNLDFELKLICWIISFKIKGIVGGEYRQVLWRSTLSLQA